jgi:hypothetical protein
LEIATNKIYLSSIGFIIDNEYHRVEPQGLTITLDHEIVLSNVEAETLSVSSPPGVFIPIADFKINYQDKKITFVEGYQYQDVWVSYSRKLETDIGPSVSLDALKTGLTEMTYLGYSILDVTINTGGSVSLSSSSDGLYRSSSDIRSDNSFIHPTGGIQEGLSFRWTNLSIHHLLDKKYWDRFYNEDGHLLNTLIESYVDSFKKKTHITWEQVVLDEDVWDAVDVATENASHLPFLLDAKFGYWTSSNLAQTTRYETTQAFDRGFIAEHDKSLMTYVGIPTEQIKSGIGRDKDLKVVVPKPSIVEVLTEPDVFRATINWSITGQVEDSTFLPNTPYGSLLFGL